MATLLLELSLTRLFSVVFHYHFAFLAISMGHVWPWRWRSLLLPRRRVAVESFFETGSHLRLNALVVLVSLIISLSIREKLGFWSLAAVYFPSTLPFFLAGTVVSLAIAESIDRVERVYFYDLVGAGAGCLLLVPLLNTLAVPIPFSPQPLLTPPRRPSGTGLASRVDGRVASVALALGLLLLLGYNAKYPHHRRQVRQGKGSRGRAVVKWNSFSRIGGFPRSGFPLTRDLHRRRCLHLRPVLRLRSPLGQGTGGRCSMWGRFRVPGAARG